MEETQKMKFKRIVLWSEFPHKTNWKKLGELLKEADFHPDIYVACTSPDNYKWWAREIKKQCKSLNEINAWPVLTKAEGYWFSGFTSKDCIDRLLEYKDTKVKIDLEPPLPKIKYTNFGIAMFLFKLLVRKGKNNKHLFKTITKASEKNDVLVNEFPIPKPLLKRWGCYYPTHNKNVMCYTSLLRYRSPLRLWNFWMAKRRKARMCSIGLIHSGIFTDEPYYTRVEELEKDLLYAQKQGFEEIAVYSIDAIMKRKDPTAWISSLKKFY